MIEFQNVTKIYPNGVKALDGVSLTIEQGEFVAIIGLSSLVNQRYFEVLTKCIRLRMGHFWLMVAMSRN
ncbi:hypothetical protein MGH68_11265 [Erysipelothrix sp. D19-032]